MNDDTQFDAAFRALTGHDPFPWQRNLFHRLVDGSAPRSCDIPTGLGKTAVVAVWLIALANRPDKLPRRLVYVVNRRTVVDQTTDEVQKLRANLKGAGLSERLKQLCAIPLQDDEPPLAISTLRGQFADNREWSADPARPAVIVGTVDMVGSKLLFSGYGDTRYWRGHHGGLLGQDTLIVHDEAHLTPAFSRVLRRLEKEQAQWNEPRPIRVLELSATASPRSAAGEEAENGDLRLGDEDQENAIVEQRINARKLLTFHIVDSDKDKDALVKRVVELARNRGERAVRVLIYVRSPDDAQKVADRLGEQDIFTDRIGLLTGTIRGHERDKLTRMPLFRWFIGETDEATAQFAAGGTAYLVSTSAGEVGVDLDADHLVCDLTTLDSMIQRLGRVNRRGGAQRVASVDVVVSKEKKRKPSEIEAAVQATYEIFRGWIADSEGSLEVSPAQLRTLVDGLTDEEKKAAFAPTPEIPPLTDILLDAWSLTSITEPMPGRPEVAAYLHGLTGDPPETYVAWRKEVTLLAEAKLDIRAAAEWFGACRIESRERRRDRTDRLHKAMGGLLQTHRKKIPDCDFSVVLLDERGKAEWSTLATIVDRQFNLAYRTIVLPVEAGGLSERGMLDSKTVEPIAGIDVAEMTTEGDDRERWLRVSSEDGEQYERLVTGEIADSLPQDLRELERVALKEPVEGAEEEGQWKYLVLMVPPKQSALENPETARTQQSLEDHTRRTVCIIRRIADALGLDETLTDALATAAECHDRGKDRPVWQRYACNPDPGTPRAKSRKYLHPRVLGGYRHEFGSLLDATADEQSREHPHRDLILHLIAAHHGWARPHFEPHAADSEATTQANHEAAVQAMRRFGQLQKRYGRWGLAWLESLLRCADGLASADIRPRSEADS